MEKEGQAPADENSICRSLAIWLVSFLGAAGIGLQNYAAFLDFLFSVTRFSWEIVQGLAISLGGFCSTVINHCINVDLLSAFMERLYPLTEDGKKKKEERRKYHTKLFDNIWTQLQYWGGACIFIVTGILFGLTALSFSSLNALAIVAIAAGVFVAIIMMIQELETWLSAFDPPENWADQKSTESTWQEELMAWFKSRTLGHWIGTLIAIGNVLASSLFFTAGLAGFLTTIGVPSFPAFISGLVIAFTIGAFTEFYFYNFFLGSFCANIDKRWQALINSDYCIFGLFTIAINGAVNGVLGYSGVLLLEPVFIAVGLSAPPLALAIVAGIFAGLASLFLGSDFWIKNWRGIIDAMGNAWGWIWNNKPTPQTPELITEMGTPTAAKSFHSEGAATKYSPHNAAPENSGQPSRSCLALLMCR